MNRIHPLSVLLGLALAALCFVTMSQTPVIGPAAIRIEYIPHPRDMVKIREGTPYVVPAGKLFVLTALGSTYPVSGGERVRLFVNGQDEALTRLSNSYNGSSPSSSDIVPVPPGFTVGAGSVITLLEGGPTATDARAWGYL